MVHVIYYKTMEKKFYIDNKRFEEVIKLYQKDPKKNEDELVRMFDLLIENIIFSFNFKLDRDDAKQECFLLVLKVLKNFDPNHGSAFNYFTTVIVNNLKLMFTKAKRYNQKINAYTEREKEKSKLDR